VITFRVSIKEGPREKGEAYYFLIHTARGHLLGKTQIPGYQILGIIQSMIFIFHLLCRNLKIKIDKTISYSILCSLETLNLLPWPNINAVKWKVRLANRKMRNSYKIWQKI
jgi:hypothetical protein